MNPKQFLLVGGIVLLALGLVGFLGVFNDTKSAFYLDQGENVAQMDASIGDIRYVLARHCQGR